MQIIKDTNNVVVFAGKDFVLTNDRLITPGWTSPAVNSTTHIIETVDSIPGDFKGGHYTYTNDTWDRTSAGENALSKELSILKIKKNAEINTIRYSKIYQASIPYTFPGDTEPDGIQMRDEVDRQNIQDFVIDAMSRDSSDVMYFMPVSNTLKSLTAQEAITMGLTLKARGDSLIGYSWLLKEQIQATETVDELLALDINSGWPL